MNKFQRFKEILILKRASVIVIVGSFLCVGGVDRWV